LSKASKWTSVAFPKELVEAIRKLIEELEYWPSVTSFCREAAIEKIKREGYLLKDLKELDKKEEGETRAEREGAPQ